MPSARDLMQKADSLMRSNRSIGVSESDQEIPVLTDVVIRGEASILRTQRTDAQPMTDSVIDSPIADAPSPVAASREDAESIRERIESEKRALAEAVFFEVVRDLDIESPDGMRGLLSSQLTPLFEAMSRELVDRLQHALAEAIRDQVAMAIERKLGVLPPSSSSPPRQQGGN